MTEEKAGKRPTLIVRNATRADVPAIRDLSASVYGEQQAYTLGHLRGQINNFPEGQFVADFDGRVVGYCATFITREELALAPHTWMEITGGAFASRHDPDGDVLYGMEVVVDPGFRRLRIGQRLYRKRRELCEYFELKGIVFGGRMPGYSRRAAQYPDPKDYVEAVREKKVRDSVVNFQLRQGFEPIGVIYDYDPTDKSSKGHAALMYWRNPLVSDGPSVRTTHPDNPLPQSVRVATVQFQMRRIERIEDFEEQIEYFTDVASDYEADFVTFPELYTLQLLALETKRPSPLEAIEKIADYKERYCEFMSRLAVSYNINIVGGTHPTRVANGDIHNVAYVFLRDGAVYEQDKLHPTPSERTWWNIKGGDRNEVIPTDCGPIGVMICYDCEFPEVARHLTDQGATILFVPFCTDERRGYLRVRYCAQARAVENQCYVVMAGVVGNLPNVESMDIHYAQSCILTPSDFPFSRDGIAAETAVNTETVALADLSLYDLLRSRQHGSVLNLKDRRFDLYQVRWTSPGTGGSKSDLAAPAATGGPGSHG